MVYQIRQNIQETACYARKAEFSEFLCCLRQLWMSNQPMFHYIKQCHQSSASLKVKNVVVQMKLC